MQQSDRELVCASCNRPFVFTGAEQAFFVERGFQEPRRCKPCRAARKAEGTAAEGSAGRGPRGVGGRAPQGGGNTRGGNVRGGVSNAGRGNARASGPMASAEDPNGYRAPGFSGATSNPHAIDYAGLPRDVEDGSAPGSPPPANSGEREVDRFGLRTSSAGSFGGYTRRRGPAGYTGGNDRSGTDPNAYRAPGFAGSAPGDARGRGDARRVEKAPRAPRAMFDVTCASCGASAQVPFEPTAERPAYCKPCFDARRAEKG